ncbi:MAG: hypothetical protein DRI34_00865 [Deltaproteobacteria bacterium]|nr:MAG: hypothetical protein DRI34_00865 [Deltaproteobacteria bacterium]
MGRLTIIVLAAVLPGSGARAANGHDGGSPPALVEEKPEPARCLVSMQFGFLVDQQVTITPGRVKGPDFNLRREGDTYYGFILSRPTRFRVKPGEISGTACGMDLMLHVFDRGRVTEITGLVGARRVRARISDQRVTVDAGASTMVESSAHLALVRERGNRLSGQFGQGSQLAPARLVTAGCDLDYLRRRPGLVVILFLWWLGV